MFQLTSSLFVALTLVVFTGEVHSEIVTPNQTSDVSPIFSSDSLPFTIDIELANIEVPGGIQTFAYGLYKEKYVFISGRTNGLHGFGSGDDNFPPLQQNRSVFVFDLKTNEVYMKSLEDPSSGLSQSEIDSLSTTAAQYTQTKQTLYLVGGYGVDSETGEFSTKSTLSAIDLKGLIHWVINPSKGETAKEHIRQISNPIFQVTGGALYQLQPHEPFLLVFGQDFEGFYSGSSNGVYTQQIRTFKLVDDGVNLAVFSEKYKTPGPNYRRRDLNVVPIVQKQGQSYETSLLALSGVFTLNGGIWTIPVFVDAYGNSFMPSPSKETTFKQAMNNYNSAHLGMFSKKTKEMHTLLFGGLSYETYSNGSFSFDTEIPFTNNVTDIVIDKNKNMRQYLMGSEYPVILSNFTNPGNTLLFGAGACFIPTNNLPVFPESVFSLDDLKGKTLLGYIVGGIMSTLPNTSDRSDSAASPYIFKVYATPQ